MRLLRHKQNRKTLNYYRIVHGVHTPYRLLVDGNFVVVAERLRMEWKRLVPKLLETNDDPNMIHWHITECILHELQNLGSEYQSMYNIALTLPVLKCRHKHGHTSAMDASSCIKALVGTKNEGKWFILSQDKELRSFLRSIPGTPLILLSNNVLVLEQPSKASKRYNQTQEVEKTTLRPDELVAVKQAVKQLSSSAAASASSSVSSFSSTTLTKSFPTKSTTTTGPSKGSNGTNVTKKRKKGPSEPNPLSVKRKRVNLVGATSSSLSSSSSSLTSSLCVPNHSSGETNEPGQKKQRRRKHKHASKDSVSKDEVKHRSNTVDDDDDDDNDDDSDV